MKKIPNLFERDWNGNKSRVLPELHKGADVAWVLAGEGVPTVKWDGSAVMIRRGELFVRLDCKRGKTPPAGFEQCQDEDPVTGHRPGWIPAAGNPAASWHRDAFINSGGAALPDGTYEACGPQLQSNPYAFPRNILIRHGINDVVLELPAKPAAAFDCLKTFLETQRYFWGDMPAALPMEGLVWHHPDGRMVKVLASDLGLPWKVKSR